MTGLDVGRHFIKELKKLPIADRRNALAEIAKIDSFADFIAETNSRRREVADYLRKAMDVMAKANLTLISAIKKTQDQVDDVKKKIPRNRGNQQQREEIERLVALGKSQGEILIAMKRLGFKGVTVGAIKGVRARARKQAAGGAQRIEPRS